MILIECSRETPIERIHESAGLIELALSNDVEDLVPAYHSIAIFTSLKLEEAIEKLNGFSGIKHEHAQKQEVIKLPICYELGLDLSRVAERSGMSKKQVIERHLKGTYRSLFIGFTPGFIYADGLDESLACPRLEQPRKQIPPGSVGIAGSQTGIYSLASPGGWNIIGVTPMKVFDPNRQLPMLIDVGAEYCFYRITKEESEAWED